MGDEADSLAGAALLRHLMNKPEKEIIKLLQQNPELASQKIFLTCLGQLKVDESPECRCSQRLETLQGCEDQTTEDLLAEIHSSLLLGQGVCPHVLSILKNYDGTQLPSESTAKPQVKDNIHEMITWLYKTHKHSSGVDLNQYLAESSSERSVRSYMLKNLIPYSCTASISAIHVATALGKHKLLCEILSDRVTPVGSLCFHFESGYHSVSPYHVAVLHRQYKAIDILRKKFPRMACNMDRHFGRGNITPSTLAAQRNDATALRHLLKDRSSCGGLNATALRIALENRSMDCAEFLIKRNHARLDRGVVDRSLEVPYMFDLHESDPTFKLLKDLLVKPFGRDRFLKLLVDYDCFPIHTIVSFCIYCDATETTKYLLESTKAASLTHFPKYMCLLTMATIKNSPSLLNILVRYVRASHFPLYTVSSPLYWAIVLHYDACVNILEKALKSFQGHKERFDIDYATDPPFPALLLEAKWVDFDRLGALRRLKEIGYDINATTRIGESCLNLATAVSVKKNGTLVSFLLEQGADVFATKMYKIAGQGMYMYPSMLLRLLLANVDICGPQARGPITELPSSRPQIITSTVSSPMQLLILRTAHTICEENIDFLRSKLTEWDRNSTGYQDLFDHLREYIDSPQPLVRLCRNSIRRATGIHLHKFLEGQILPQRLVNMLMLKEDLEPYWQSCKENIFWGRQL